MTEIRLLGSNLSTIDPDDLHGYNPDADTGHLLMQLPDRTKKIVLFEAVYLNLGLHFSSVNYMKRFLLYVYPEAR